MKKETLCVIICIEKFSHELPSMYMNSTDMPRLNALVHLRNLSRSEDLHVCLCLI
jgi:hypothetical protein